MKAIDITLLAFGLTAFSLLSCSKEETAPEAVKVNLRIMSFNLRSSSMGDTGDMSWTARKNAVQKMVEDKSPFIIGMQEAMQDGKSNCMRDDLKSLLPRYAMMEVPNTGTSKGGNTVMMYDTMKVTLIEKDCFYLSSTPDVPSVNGWNDETQYRTSIWGKFREKTSGLSFYVLNTHMPLKATEDGITARTNSAKLNVARLKLALVGNSPVFVLGDMNCSQPEKGLNPYLDEAYSPVRKDYGDEPFSYNAFGKSKGSNLDHIFYRNVNRVEFSTVTDNYGVPYISDHYPVYVDATVKIKQ